MIRNFALLCLGALLGALAAAPASLAAVGAADEEFVPGEVIVGLRRAGVRAAAAQHVHRQHRIAPMEHDLHTVDDLYPFLTPASAHLSPETKSHLVTAP